MPRAKVTYRDGTIESIYYETCGFQKYTFESGMVSFWKGRNHGYLHIPMDTISRIEDED